MIEGPTVVPMFPLGTVVFPYTAVPLRVFEPRYQVLLDRVAGGDRMFGTVLIERGSEVGGGDRRFDVGTLVRLEGVSPLDDGQSAVVVAGVARVRVSEWLPDDPHPWAEVVEMPDQDQDTNGLVREVHRRLERVMALASELGADVADVDLAVAEDPLAASYQLAALAPLPAFDAYQLLAASGPAERLESASDLLDIQADSLNARLAAG